MRVRAVMLAAVVVLGSASAMAKPYTFEKQYKAAVKQENTGDITGALAAFEASVGHPAMPIHRGLPGKF